MKVSHEEGLADNFGLQGRGGPGDRNVLSVRAKGNAGQPLSSDITTFVCRSCCVREKAISGVRRTVTGKVRTNTAESENLCMRGYSKLENREVRLVSTGNEKR